MAGQSGTLKIVLVTILLNLWIGGHFGALSDLSTTHDPLKKSSLYLLFCGCNHLIYYFNVATA